MVLPWLKKKMFIVNIINMEPFFKDFKKLFPHLFWIMNAFEYMMKSSSLFQRNSQLTYHQQVVAHVYSVSQC